MQSTFSLRDYQLEAVTKGGEILKAKGLLILNYEVRTGKSHIALSIGSNYSNVLFVTKLKAISSIQKDYATAGYTYPITIINYEQLHKHKSNYDLVIFDESHSLAAFPKPSIRTKQAKRICANGCKVILMTGTLLPESNAQIFHQLFVSNYSPFRNYANFYKWHNDFGTIKLKYTSYGTSNDYSVVSYEKVIKYIDPIMLTYTQKEAGFVSEIKEHFMTVEMKPSTYAIIDRLSKDLIIEGKSGVVLADTSVKLMQKVHQMYSGTVKFEDGNRIDFDDSKAVAIKQRFAGKKIAIFYKFIAELDAIKKHFDVTDNIEEFNNSNKTIALQIISGREGINLSSAEALVYYNIDFSAISYWQSRDRCTTINRTHTDVYWMFAKDGIEWQIYKSVAKKKDFVLQTFKKWQVNTKPKS
jgi:hypothetical protein